ncbi:Wdrepeat proteinlike, partial [Caligus rogercresseyi]
MRKIFTDRDHGEGMDKENGSVLFEDSLLGNVCNSIPIVVRYVKRRRETLIVTAVEDVFIRME